MSLRQDVVDIYTKSSVYYLRLQYLVVCYLIVLLLAAFILPLPRTYGLNGGLRLFVGLALYVGFAVLMTYRPKLLHSSAGKYLSPDEYEEELTKKFKQMPSKHQVELEEKILARKQAKFKIIAKQNDSTVSKKQGIAAVIYFQCLLFELFCVATAITTMKNFMAVLVMIIYMMKITMVNYTVKLSLIFFVRICEFNFGS